MGKVQNASNCFEHMILGMGKVEAPRYLGCPVGSNGRIIEGSGHIIRYSYAQLARCLTMFHQIFWVSKNRVSGENLHTESTCPMGTSGNSMNFSIFPDLS